MKKIFLCFIALFFTSLVFIGGTFADNPTGGGRRPIVPEPVNCLLFLASGATYAGIRYLRARMNARKFDKHSHDNTTGQ